MAETVISLPIPPTSNNLFAGVSRRHRSHQYDAWIKEAGFEILRQKPRPVHGRVTLLIQVAEPKTDRSSDIGNREKAIVDLLVKMRMIEGDSHQFVRRITLEWSSEVEAARVTITAIEGK